MCNGVTTLQRGFQKWAEEDESKNMEIGYLASYLHQVKVEIYKTRVVGAYVPEIKETRQKREVFWM